MLYLAAHLYRLSIEALSPAPVSSDPARAIIQAGRVVQMSASARQAGVLQGQSTATARAICPSITLIDRDPNPEHLALHKIACCALRFTPQISLIEPDAQRIDPAGLILDIGRSLRLFGGAGALGRHVRQDMQGHGLSARLCMAPTATGAWLLAQQHDGLLIQSPDRLREALQSLPIHTLRSCDPHLESLNAAGLRTIGQLMALPRAGLARRFGPALLAEIDRALGERPDAYRMFEPPSCFDAELELPAAIDSTAPLVEAARRLILQGCGWLSARQTAALRMDFTAHHGRRTPPTSISVRVECASRDPDHWTVLLKEHLQHTRLAAPAQSLHLHCEWTVAQAGQPTELFPDAQAEREQMDRLLDRLQARLGREHVLRLETRADHRPEHAQHLRPGATTEVQRRVRSQSASLWSLPRPVWLIDPPVALAERNNRPYLNSPLRLIAGPERIETGWWDRELALRDYFIAEDSGHHLLWIFRARLPGPSGQTHQEGWFLQGRYG
ncbi:MAG: hypothetical protein RL322_2469 [Pseudomonadota bacterium]|jgi:protein ImuB